MPTKKFLLQPEETILFHAIPNSKWYVLAWKILSGMIGITLLIFIINSLLAGSIEAALLSCLPPWTAHLISTILFLVFFPLAALAWVAEDFVSTIIGELILTNQRIWIRGSPYSWSQSATRLEDIASLTWRRDAIFLKKRSSQKVQVHMFSDGNAFVKAYEQLIEKSKTN